MASPVADTYSVASGVIYGGRWQNARVSIWGQSNAKGGAYRTGIYTSPLSSDPELGDWDSGAFSRVYIWNGSAYALLEPSVNNGATAGYFGPEFGLAVRWERETTSGNLYIDKQAYGGVGIGYFDPDNYDYSVMIGEHSQANVWLASNGVSVDVVGWLWVQGESDAAQSQSYYQPLLEELIAANESNGVILTNTLKLLAKQHPSTDTYGAGPQLAKDAIAAANPSSTEVFVLPFTAMMEADNIHVNARGQLQLGYYAFERFFNTSHLDA